MFGLGATEVVVILILALIFIGPKKLPELAKGLGKGLREFQKAKDDILNSDDNDQKDDEASASSEKIAQSQAETPPTGVSTPTESKEKKEEA